MTVTGGRRTDKMSVWTAQHPGQIDTNSYSVPSRLIGGRVAVTVAAGELRVRHGVREVAVHKQYEGRRLRIVNSSHLGGVVRRHGTVCRAGIAPLPPGAIAAAPKSDANRPLASPRRRFPFAMASRKAAGALFRSTRPRGRAHRRAGSR
jgi:hypothetical protein